MSDGAERATGDATGKKAGKQSRAIAHCRLCKQRCDVLVMAAVGADTTVVWKCPMRLGSERMDQAVSLALIRASLSDTPCIIVRESDVESWDG